VGKSEGEQKLITHTHTHPPPKKMYRGVLLLFRIYFSGFIFFLIYIFQIFYFPDFVFSGFYFSGFYFSGFLFSGLLDIFIYTAVEFYKCGKLFAKYNAEKQTLANVNTDFRWHFRRNELLDS
jgi:hypothetical protein